MALLESLPDEDSASAQRLLSCRCGSKKCLFIADSRALAGAPVLLDTSYGIEIEPLLTKELERRAARQRKKGGS